MGLVRLDEESEEFLKRVKQALPEKKNGKGASYSDAIKYLHKEHTDIKSVVQDHMDALHQVLLVHYHGNKAKAHITEQLRAVLVKALKSENHYKLVSQRLMDILDEDVK